jgi:hypothetical protein
MPNSAGWRGENKESGFGLRSASGNSEAQGAGNAAQMLKSTREFYGRPTVELTNWRKRGALGRFFNH